MLRAETDLKRTLSSAPSLARLSSREGCSLSFPFSFLFFLIGFFGLALVDFLEESLIEGLLLEAEEEAAEEEPGGMIANEFLRCFDLEESAEEEGRGWAEKGKRRDSEFKEESLSSSAGTLLTKNVTRMGTLAADCIGDALSGLIRITVVSGLVGK